MKKALIITYYWPPSGGGGVQRWLKFVKYLRDYDWEPVIYTPDNPDFELQDKTLQDDVPEDLEVIRRPIWEPYGTYRKLLGKKAVQQQGVVSTDSRSLLSRLSIWVRGNYFIPDSRVFWVRPSVNFLTRYLKNSDIDVVITTGPPHSMHLIGLELKKRLNINWVADFRDPWSQWDVLDQLNLSKKSKENHLRLENQVLNKANLVLTVSPTLEQSLKNLGATSTKLITNGYDSEVISDENTIREKFRVSHIGLLNTGRNPIVLWQVLSDLCKVNPEFNDKLEIFLAGTVETEVLDSIRAHENLLEKLNFGGYRSHNEVINDYSLSSLLLLLINNTANAKWILPGKMFEYIGQNRDILALGEPDSDASNLLANAGHSKCKRYDDVDSIRKQVSMAFENYRSESASSIKSNIEKFHRRELTKELASCLDKLE